MTESPTQTRAQTAQELERAGWFSVAADIRDGLSADTVLSRLRGIGEGYSEAAEIVADMDGE